MVDARQTLLTEKAQSCGADLISHTGAFVEGIDFTVVTDIPGLKKAASDYREKPPPSCLPSVPAGNGGAENGEP